jgi:hypothetical protein
MNGPAEVGTTPVDDAYSAWRQGDCFLQEADFAYIAQSSVAEGKGGVAGAGQDAIRTARVPGLVVVTQTCDIVRSIAERPFVEVVPLQRVSKPVLDDVRRIRRPQFALVPGVAEGGVVADLDRSMTVDKAVLSKWKRTTGCRSDDEFRRFQAALARKRQRFAFPDDFTGIADGLQRRISEKHGKQTQEGDALRALIEIRVRAAPSWESTTVEVYFWFIHDGIQAGHAGRNWGQFVDVWLDLVKPSGRFLHVDGDVVSWEDMSAKEYLESDQLDLDRLSIAVN